MPDQLPKFSSVGGYPQYYLDSDENVLCATCADECDDVDWLATAHPNWENPSLHCNECSERIESAYAEPTDICHCPQACVRCSSNLHLLGDNNA